MKNPQWQIPDSRGADNLIPVTWRVPLAFLAALKEFASEQTRVTGKKISMSTIVTTLSRQASPKLNDLVGKYETEMPAHVRASSDFVPRARPRRT
jgi:hypothetical protein